MLILKHFLVEFNELSFFEIQQKNLEDFNTFTGIKGSNPLQIKKLITILH